MKEPVRPSSSAPLATTPARLAAPPVVAPRPLPELEPAPPLKDLRPAAGEKPTWNRKAGRVDGRPDAKAPEARAGDH
jgi:hypothetical protein